MTDQAISPLRRRMIEDMGGAPGHQWSEDIVDIRLLRVRQRRIVPKHFQVRFLARDSGDSLKVFNASASASKSSISPGLS